MLKLNPEAAAIIHGGDVIAGGCAILGAAALYNPAIVANPVGGFAGAFCVGYGLATWIFS